MTPERRALLVLAAFIVPLAACPSGTQGFPFVGDVNGAYRAEGQIGSTVIVEGVQFGDVQGSSALYFTNNLGGVALAAPVSQWNNTFIVATVPVGAFSGPVSVNNGNGPNNGLQFFTITPASAFTPSAIGAWNAAPALPVALSGQAVTFGYIGSGTPLRVIYATGGSNNTNAPVTNVYFSTVPASGTISAWTSTAPLPQGLAFHAAVMATPGNSAVSTTTGFLLVIGGATDAAGTSRDSILAGTINADGSIGNWHGAGKLPQALHSVGATVFMGHLYVVGGAGTGNTPVATVYRAVIQPNGTINTSDWTTLTALPAPRARFGFAQFNGNLYVVGGDATAHQPNDTSTSGATNTIYYAKVDLYSRNLLTGWKTNTATLPQPRLAETVVVGGLPTAPSMLISGGLYPSGGTDELYATVSPTDGSVGTLATLATSLPASLFNQAATGYYDASLFHMLIVGGDDRAAPGTKHAQTFSAP